MRYFAAVTAVIALCGCSPPLKRIETPDLNSKWVFLTEPPKIELSESSNPPPSNSQIETLIASLAAIDSPDCGLSQTMTGHAFLALEGRMSVEALLLTDQKFQSSGALKALVQMGPPALPSLLAHLNDTQPTKLRITHDYPFGAMNYANELMGNPVNSAEQSVLQARQQDETSANNDEGVESYTVKVGDVCFVAVGQIVGREYSAVRYQPTACIVLNSPTHDPALCAEVRAIWASHNPRKKVLDSLLVDYATRGKFNGDSLDGWDLGSSLQIEAAMRLLYYFPSETATMIADRINNLIVSDPEHIWPAPGTSRVDAYIKREVANGVRTKEFLASVMWSKQPAIIAAIKGVAARTDDPEIIDLLRHAPE